MRKVISIGSDRKIFDPSSAVRARVVAQGRIFEELHIVVFSLSPLGLKEEKIAPNVWIYPTNTITRFGYIRSAIRISNKIVKERKMGEESVITAQDPFEAGFVASSVSKKTGLKMHLQIHTDFLNPYFKSLSFLNMVRVLIARKVLPKADGIRVVSRRIKESLSSLKLKTVPYVAPIFVGDIKNENSKIDFDLHNKYPDTKLIVLCVGRLEPEKNFSLAIRSIVNVAKVYPFIGLVIVGSGSQKEKLRNEAREWGVENRVFFESWQDDLSSYYKTADMYLSTSLYEGYGMSLVEAVSYGCPVVSTDVGIVRELLTDEASGFICPVNDVNCLSEKILLLTKDSLLRKRLSVNLSLSQPIPGPKNLNEYLDAYRESIDMCFK